MQSWIQEYATASIAPLQDRNALRLRREIGTRSVQVRNSDGRIKPRHTWQLVVGKE
jgi:hypothetical protein